MLVLTEYRRFLPSMHAVVCDFPLPWTPQTKAENGMLVLRNSRESWTAVVDVKSELPSSPYCGRSVLFGDSSIPLENSTAFLILLTEDSSRSFSVSEFRWRSCSWISDIDEASLVVPFSVQSKSKPSASSRNFLSSELVSFCNCGVKNCGRLA